MFCLSQVTEIPSGTQTMRQWVVLYFSLVPRTRTTVKASYRPIKFRLHAWYMRKATITAFDASTTLSKSSFEHDDISGKKKKKKLNKFKRWRLTAYFLALLTTSNYKLRSHNSPRTSHLPHTSPQMRIGKILIYANCD